MYIVRRKVQQQQCCLWQRFCTKNYSAAAAADPNSAKLSYEQIIQQRQLQAQRSIIVQVQSEKSFNELYNYCSDYGQISAAQHYYIRQDEAQHYILLEYASSEEAATAISSSAYNEDLTGVPVHSPFLWFRAAAGKRAAKTKAALPLSTVNGTETLDTVDLNNLLRAAHNIDEQIQLLHAHTQLNDLGVRLRFLAALQVEQALSGMFPQAKAQPFGSSVNGFGKMGCDLDLILRFDQRNDLPETMSSTRNDSRLVFHTKQNLTNGRSQVQRQMESIGDMLHLFLPGVCHVRRILQARVPIIKYHHEHLNLEVDLSMSNLSGFYMSEILYMLGEFDWRVRPLTFCIRRWAQVCGLTNPSPGRWITNFSLTCMVIFFLQQTKQPVLPNINAFIKTANKEDIRFTEDGINCSFGRDFAQIDFKGKNTNKSSLSELLLQFFEFYSQFDFNNRAISLNEARAISKPDHSALYIVNPLEQLLNVSKNISLEECERLRIEVRNAAWILESEVENLLLPENEKLETSWGLLNLFKTPEKSIIRPHMFFKPRMVEVSDLFETGGRVTTAAAVEETNKVTTTTTTNSFKSSQVKQQVQNIKAQARLDLKQMRDNLPKERRSR